MVEQKNKVAEAEPPHAEVLSKRSKKGLLLGGGALAVVAVAAAVALMAIPSATKPRSMKGPFVMALAALEDGQALTANLAGEGGRRFLIMDLKIEYDAYDEAYGLQRIADPLYLAKLQDRLLTIASQKSTEDVLERGSQELFLAELKRSIEPILFPVHVGKTTSPTDVDEESGLRPGRSAFESTVRSAIHETVLTVDGPNKKLRLGAGEEYAYTGTEEDLAVRDETGRTLYLDTGEITPDFVGEVDVGVKGRIRNLYKVKLLVQ